MDTLNVNEQRRAVKHGDPANRLADEGIRRLLNLPPDDVPAFDRF